MIPTAELISTGAELLNGRTVNRHGQVLGSMLKSIGIRLVRDTTVADDHEAIRDALSGAVDRSDYIFVTGGLGPTNDDLTREAVSAVAGKPLVRDEMIHHIIAAQHEERGREYTGARQKQSDIVEGADVMPNPAGIAPGQRLDIRGKTVFLLPGPPREFVALMQVHVMPWLQEQVDMDRLPHERVFMIAAMGESDVHAQVEAAVDLAGLDLSYCAAPSRVELTVQSADATALEAAATRILTVLKGKVYAQGRKTMEEVVAELLTARGRTVAVAESCTGGQLGGRFTAIPGSSAWFAGGIIAYRNEVKERLLGVSGEVLEQHGAVSEPTASAMANGVRGVFGTDYALSITGIAGPDGGTAEKPVGLVYIGLADADGEWVERNVFRGDRGLVRERSVQKAMEMLWCRLTGSP